MGKVCGGGGKEVENLTTLPYHGVAEDIGDTPGKRNKEGLSPITCLKS